LAAAQGLSNAQNNLGSMYANGQGIAQDYAEAARWYKLAAAQGSVGAQVNLGLSYANGQGILQDNIRAHMWFNLAAVNGDENAIKYRKIIVEEMTPQQIAQAQILARECQARNFKKCD